MTIYEKYWSFGSEVVAGTKTHSFLFWKWETIEYEYKYRHKYELLDEVNKFIQDNDIINIISFKNTAEVITVVDYDTEWRERRGGIKLTYTL